MSSDDSLDFGMPSYAPYVSPPLSQPQLQATTMFGGDIPAFQLPPTQSIEFTLAPPVHFGYAKPVHFGPAHAFHSGPAQAIHTGPAQAIRTGPAQAIRSRPSREVSQATSGAAGSRLDLQG